MNQEDIEELKNKFHKLLKDKAGEHVANAYHDYYIEGAKNWSKLIENSNQWDRYGLRASGKAKVLKSILAPHLEKLGFKPEKIKKDFQIDKKTSKIKNLSNKDIEEYKEKISKDDVLDRLFNFVVFDKDLDFSNPMNAPYDYIINHTTNSKTRGFLADIEMNLRGSKKAKIMDLVKKYEQKYPNISQALLQNPSKGGSVKPKKHIKGMDF